MVNSFCFAGGNKECFREQFCFIFGRVCCEWRDEVLVQVIVNVFGLCPKCTTTTETKQNLISLHFSSYSLNVLLYLFPALISASFVRGVRFSIRFSRLTLV